MRLRNKKTGEMGIVSHFDNQSIVIYPIDENWNAKGDKKYVYASLAELNKEWEDYEEPKEYWYIAELCAGLQKKQDTDNGEDRFNKQIGNYFETEEEAELAVRKLEAWKRLKEKIIDHVLKYEFDEMTEDIYSNISFSVESYPSVGNDLDLLFGGEE